MSVIRKFAVEFDGETSLEDGRVISKFTIILRAIGRIKLIKYVRQRIMVMVQCVPFNGYIMHIYYMTTIKIQYYKRQRCGTNMYEYVYCGPI